MPQLRALLDSVDRNTFDARKDEVRARLDDVQRDNDVAGLATPREGQRWQQVQHIQSVLERANPSGADVEEMREKARLLRGVLFWELNANYKARLWGEQKQMRELEVALKDAQRRWVLVDRARIESPKRTEEFATRVAGLRPQIDALTARLTAAREAQNRYLAAIAIADLEAKKQRLAAYAVQAHFALASIYDRAAADGAGDAP
jgi:hypothetical protein